MTAGLGLPAGADPVVEAAFVTGDFDHADATLDGALAAARTSGDRGTEAAMLHWQGMARHYRVIDGGLPEYSASAAAAAELFSSALALRRELNDRGGIAESLFGLGLVHQVLRRDWDAAMPYFREALALADAHGDLLTRSEAYRHVGFFHLVVDGRADQAVDHLRRSLELREELADPRLLPTASLALGQALLAAGRQEDAVEAPRSAVAQAAAAGVRPRWTGAIAEWLRRAEAGDGFTVR